MKKSVSLFTLSLFFINLVSAQFFNSFGGGYGSFSIRNFLESFGPENIVYLCLFFIFFTFLFRILIRLGIFRDHYGNPQTGSAAVISLAITGLILVGFYRSGYDVQSIFYNLGFTASSLWPLLLIAFLLAMFLIVPRLGAGNFLLIIGLLLGLVALFTDIIDEKGLALIISAVIILIGLLFHGRRINRMGGRMARGIGGRYSWRQESSQWRGRTYVLILGVLGLMLGLVIGNTIISIVSGVLILTGFYLWNRRRQGSYRPLMPGYKPIQEARQFRSGSPIFFLGALVAILGLVLGNTVVMIIGAALAALGLLLRMF